MARITPSERKDHLSPEQDNASTLSEPMMSDYAERLAQQLAQYAATVNVDELPVSFHFWSHSYIRPGLHHVFGVETVPDFYLAGYRRAASGSALQIKTILSLGCGDGSMEIDIARRLIAEGIEDFRISGVDVSLDLLAQFGAKINELDLARWLQPAKLDLNAPALSGPWTMVMANHALHHFVGLEYILDYCLATLEPQGLLVCNDMIGRNGHMRWPETRVFLQSIWPLLSVEQRYHCQIKRYSAEFIDHDCSTDGSEGIRSQDILHLLLERFYPAAFLGAGGFVDILTDRGYGHGFDMALPQDAALIRYVSDLNEILLDANVIKPTIMFGHFALHDGPERCFKDRSARRSVREETPKWVAWHDPESPTDAAPP